jgi:hypothetical protein
MVRAARHRNPRRFEMVKVRCTIRVTQHDFPHQPK